VADETVLVIGAIGTPGRIAVQTREIYGRQEGHCDRMEYGSLKSPASL